MSTEQSLIDNITALLASDISPNISLIADGSDLFEAYVFCLLIKAAKREGAQVTYVDVNGSVARNFTFRTSPGYIYSKTRPYTHAVLTFPYVPKLEAHLGIRVAGKSEVLHECDIAVVEQAEAVNCRTQRVPPRSIKVLLAVECKYYASSLDLNLARAFIGLTTDLSQKAIFVTNSNSPSLQKLLSARERSWEHNIVPVNTIEMERLVGKFQTIFQNYKARKGP